MVEDEKELVEIFNKFWTNHASKDPNVDNWKGYENGSEVVYFLQNKTPKTRKLMECFGYKKTKSTWDNAHEKKKEGEEEEKTFELDEERVVWGRITNVLGGPLGYGINFYVEIRNWPVEWLSESNKHTRQYVLNNIDKGKGLSTIIDTARKKVGEQEEAKKKKEDEKQAKAEQEDASAEEEEEVNVVPGTTGYVKVNKAEDEPAQSNSRVSNPRFERVKKEAETPGAEFINPDKAEPTTGSVDVTVPESEVVNSNENETHSEMI